MTAKIIAENILDENDFLSATEQEGERIGQPVLVAILRAGSVWMNKEYLWHHRWKYLLEVSIWSLKSIKTGVQIINSEGIIMEYIKRKSALIVLCI